MISRQAQSSIAISSSKEISSILLNLFKMNLRSYTKIIALLAIWGILTIATEGTFLEPRNLSNLFRQTAVIAYLAIGMVLVIAAGQIDLSVGSLAGFTGALAAMLQIYWLPALSKQWGIADISGGWFATVLSCTFAIIVGGIAGIWHGIWIAYGRVPAFIVTLGGLLVFRGAILGLTKGVNVAPMNPSFRWLGQAYISSIAGDVLGVLAIIGIIGMTVVARRNRIKYNFAVKPIWAEVALAAFSCALVILFVNQMQSYRGIPVPVMLMVILTVFFTFVSNNTRFGRYCFAIGGNREAARLSGVNIKMTLVKIYAVIGALAGVSGIVLTARLNAATANAGNLFELNAIAACVIGGTSLMGGEGSIPGAIVGALIMASVDNGMSMLNVESFWQQIIKGLILMTAVLVDVNSRRR